MHVPAEVARQAIQAAQELQVDCCLALGGGSAIGLAKAIALDTHLPIVAIPTTYAGSEMTPVYGITENQLKTTGKAAQVLPKIVIYDPALNLNLPAEISACSGMNAMAHAVEALYAENKNPVISLMALEAIRCLATALPELVQHPNDIQLREQVSYGAWLAGICLGSVGMAIHHKICHSLGAPLTCLMRKPTRLCWPIRCTITAMPMYRRWINWPLHWVLTVGRSWAVLSIN